MNLVLSPQIAILVKVVFAVLKIFFFVVVCFVLILKEYENCPSKKETEKKMELRK